MAEEKQNIFKQAADFADRNSPTILTVLNCMGVVTTAVVGVKGGIKAAHVLAEEKEKMEVEKLAFKDYARVLWKPLLPVVISGGLTIAFAIASNVASAKKISAFAGLYSTSEALLAKYQDQVVKQLGEKQEEKIRNGIVKDDIAKDPPKATSIYFTGSGEFLCRDLYSERYFMCSIEKIKEAENNIREALNDGEGVTLNEYYDEINLSHVSGGDYIGWEACTHFRIDLHEPELVEVDRLNGVASRQPCLPVSFAITPKNVFDN